jgi:hypothetical protein
MKSKKAAIGDSVIMIYRLVLVTVIAFIVLGVSAIYYDYYIDIRSVEAVIMTKQTVNCLAPEGVLDIARFKVTPDLLEQCGIKNNGRFYAEVSLSYAFLDDNQEKTLTLVHGDSGVMWVKEVYDLSSGKTLSLEKLRKYKPGYWESKYPVNVLSGDRVGRGMIFIKMLVSPE